MIKSPNTPIWINTASLGGRTLTQNTLFQVRMPDKQQIIYNVILKGEYFW